MYIIFRIFPNTGGLSAICLDIFNIFILAQFDQETSTFCLKKYFKTLEILKLATFATKLKDTYGSLDESERGD